MVVFGRRFVPLTGFLAWYSLRKYMEVGLK